MTSRFANVVEALNRFRDSSLGFRHVRLHLSKERLGNSSKEAPQNPTESQWQRIGPDAGLYHENSYITGHSRDRFS